MSKYELDHIHLTSDDPARAADFFVKTFGAEKMREGKLPTGRTTIALKLNGISFLISDPNEKMMKEQNVGIMAGLDHIGLRTGNIETAAGELKEAGVRFTAEISPMRSGKKAFFVTADNLLVELLGD